MITFHSLTFLSVFLLTLTFILPGQTNAGVNICTERPASAFLEVGYSAQSRGKLNRSNSNVSSDIYSLNLMFQGAGSDSQSWLFGLGHQYTIFDFQNLDAQTNGHQHTLYLPFFLHSKSNANYFNFSLAPALSVSSNILKQPNQYNANALQGLGSVVYQKKMSDAIDWLAGICADHRFGNFRVYPLLGFKWNINHLWKTVIAYPDSELSHRLSDTIYWRLHIGPDGNQWHIKDKALQQSSEFSHEAYLAQWQLDWSVTPGFLITASLGLVFNAEYRFTLANGEEVATEQDDSTRTTVRVRWEF